jgi:magnesium chelatase family protein
MDRIDIHIEVPRVKIDKLATLQDGESSANIRQRVNQARQWQLKRFAQDKNITNSQMSSQQVKKICQLNTDAQELLKNAVNQLHLSARAYYRILKLSRTIADLSQSEAIQTAHIAEALQYRPKVE